MVWPLISSALRRCSGSRLQVLRLAYCHTSATQEPLCLDTPYFRFGHAVEEKWQKKWQEEDKTANKSVKPYSSADKKYYVLAMFPYPSGRLHLGHVRVYAISHTLAAYKRMCGYDVMHPMGFDSFGLPAENAAIDRNIAPDVWTESNIVDMKEQLHRVGLHFDWQRELATHRPDYYKWTQWLFIKLYEHKLAYQSAGVVNWDPVDQTVLANEQVDSEGYAWRSGAKAERRELRQWFIKTSEFGRELYNGLQDVDWPAPVKNLQKKWIGPSKGTVLQFPLAENVGDMTNIEIYTTLPKDVFNASYVALSRSHPLVKEHLNLLPEENREKVREFCSAVGLERSGGADTGLVVNHPFTGNPLPVYVAGYVHDGYATGAIMACPAVNGADEVFAKEFGIPIIDNVEDGKLINAGQFSGMELDGKDSNAAINNYAKEGGFGYEAEYMRLRDWLVSRQRYWGTPIPIIHCSKCPEPVAVPVSQLPVVLPANVKLEGRGGSPLAKLHDWLNVPCPQCGSPAKRDTDTMDTFMDSAWYFLRFTDPHNEKELIVKESDMPAGTKSMLPVDTYVGGVEHAILHLMYARFIHRFAKKIGLVESSEPFERLIAQGLVKGKTFKSADDGRYLKPEELEVDGETAIEKATGKPATLEWDKMSKSKHNGIDPMDIVSKYGADVLRLYLLGDVPTTAAFKWQEGGIKGYARLLTRLWTATRRYRDELQAGGPLDESTLTEEQIADLSKLEMQAHKTINDVSRSLDSQSFTMCIIRIFSLLEELETTVLNSCLVRTPTFRSCLESSVIMLWPLAPHFSEELWQRLEDIHGTDPAQRVWHQQWPDAKDFQKHGVENWTVRVADNNRRFKVKIPCRFQNDVEKVKELVLASGAGKKVIGDRTLASFKINRNHVTVEFGDS